MSEPTTQLPTSDAPAATPAPREHFIPLRRADLVRALCDDLAAADAPAFRRFDDLLVATFHVEYHRQLERLKDNYAPFDPDADTKRLIRVEPDQKDRLLDDLVAGFRALLDRANFRRLSKTEIEAAMRQASHWGVNLTVNFDLFDRLEVFYRGEGVVTRRTPRRWFGARRGIPMEVPIYRRLVVLIRLKDGREVPDGVDTNSVHIKVFKEIPKIDLEMLLPGTRVTMSLFDRLKLGFSLSTGIGMTGYKLAGPVLGLFAGATSTSALLGIIGGTAGYCVRSFYGYVQTKQKYMLTLAQSLYFLNLDNNAGVLFRLLDEAEEQECREVLLSYALLLYQATPAGWTMAELDAAAEGWLRRRFDADVDFEADDAVAKLERLGLCSRSADERLRAVPLDEALRTLDRAWDQQFTYHQEPPACLVAADDPA